MTTENAPGDIRKGEELDVAAVDAVLKANVEGVEGVGEVCLLYTSPSPRDA